MNDDEAWNIIKLKVQNLSYDGSQSVEYTFRNGYVIRIYRAFKTFTKFSRNELFVGISLANGAYFIRSAIVQKEPFDDIRDLFYSKILEHKLTG